jgi:8-oxo-dGTP pyrophosphatase MutT (NUDIX family)
MHASLITTPAKKSNVFVPASGVDFTLEQGGAAEKPDHPVVEAFWQEQLNKNPKLFNGKVCEVRNVDWTGSRPKIQARVSRYKNVAASDKFADRDDIRVNTCGVSVCITTPQGFMLGQRSPTAGRYPGKPWFVAGFLDGKAMNEEAGTIDAKSAAEAEAREEAGLTPAELPLQPIGLMRHMNGRAYDVVFEGHTDLKADELLRRQKNAPDSWEHTKFFFVPFEAAAAGLDPRIFPAPMGQVMKYVLATRRQLQNCPPSLMRSFSRPRRFPAVRPVPLAA